MGAPVSSRAPAPWDYGIQAHRSALVPNLKRIVAWLTSIRFRPSDRKLQGKSA